MDNNKRIAKLQEQELNRLIKQATKERKMKNPNAAQYVPTVKDIAKANKIAQTKYQTARVESSKRRAMKKVQELQSQGWQLSDADMKKLTTKKKYTKKQADAFLDRFKPANMSKRAHVAVTLDTLGDINRDETFHRTTYRKRMKPGLTPEEAKKQILINAYKSTTKSIVDLRFTTFDKYKKEDTVELSKKFKRTVALTLKHMNDLSDGKVFAKGGKEWRKVIDDPMKYLDNLKAKDFTPEQVNTLEVLLRGQSFKYGSINKKADKSFRANMRFNRGNALTERLRAHLGFEVTKPVMDALQDMFENCPSWNEFKNSQSKDSMQVVEDMVAFIGDKQPIDMLALEQAFRESHNFKDVERLYKEYADKSWLDDLTSQYDAKGI